jgi:uncharacterized protein involved in exopolysaccharide biosynthesis
MPEPDADDDEHSNGPTPLELKAFLVAAARRRRKLAVLSLLLLSMVGIAFAIVKPPVFVADVTIAVRKNSTVRMIATKNGETSNDSPTKSAQTDILNDENLVALLKDAEVVERWEVERAPVMKLKDKIVQKLFGKPTDEEFARGLVSMLSKRLSVATDDNTITIHAEWQNRQGAYRLVTAAQARFMKTQRDDSLAMITDGINILQQYLQEEGVEVDKEVQELERLEAQKEATKQGLVAVPQEMDAGGAADAGAARHQVLVRSSAPPPAPALDPAIKKSLQEKKQAILALEDDRRKRLSDAEAQLADLRGTLAPAHPQVVALEHRVETLSQPSAEVVQLKAEAAALEAQLSEVTDATVARARSYLATVPGPSPVPTATRRDAGSSESFVIMTEQIDDAPTLNAKAKLAKLTDKYDELRTNLRTAKMELDAAEAAFKYKYTVMTPAEMPKRPKSPPNVVFALAGIFAGLGLFFLLPAAADLASGRIMASWQVRKLGVEVLGEIDAASTSTENGRIPST